MDIQKFNNFKEAQRERSRSRDKEKNKKIQAGIIE